MCPILLVWVRVISGVRIWPLHCFVPHIPRDTDRGSLAQRRPPRCGKMCPILVVRVRVISRVGIWPLRCFVPHVPHDTDCGSLARRRPPRGGKLLAVEASCTSLPHVPRDAIPRQLSAVVPPLRW